MSGRALLGAFALGFAVIGAAGAGLNANWSDHLTGAQEVPARPTQAQGQAIFHLSDDGNSLSYKLMATNIENVVQAHIHLGRAGANGNIVVFLYGLVPPAGGRHNGVLATGTIMEDDLINDLADASLDDLVAAMRSGNAYVNVHTNDGVAPANTGPGDFPGGEIRAQIIEE